MSIFRLNGGEKVAIKLSASDATAKAVMRFDFEV